MTGPIYPPGNLLAARRSYLEGAQVGFREAVVQAYRNAFVYRGRASRSAYWWFTLFNALLDIALQKGPNIFLGSSPPGSVQENAAIKVLIVVLLAYVWLFLVGLALTVRRLHDTDRSGWWALLLLVPFVGWITLLIFTLLRGRSGPTRYQP
jgi:uncharacterized membrane protein YhaH (DUF805 family)